jgi:hypothetical protein
MTASSPEPPTIISQYEPEPATERVDIQREREGGSIAVVSADGQGFKKDDHFLYIVFVCLSYDVFHITFKMCSVLKSDNWTVMFFLRC